MKKTLHLTALGMGLLAFEITSLDLIPRDEHDSNHVAVANNSTNQSSTQFGPVGRNHRLASSPFFHSPKKTVKSTDVSDLASRVSPAQGLKDSSPAQEDETVSPEVTLASKDQDSQNRVPVLSLSEKERPDIACESDSAGLGQALHDWTWISEPNGFNQMTKRDGDFFFTAGDIEPGADEGKSFQSLWMTKDPHARLPFAKDWTVSLGQNENTIKRFANLNFDFGLTVGGPSDGGWEGRGGSAGLFQGDALDTTQNAVQDSDLATSVQPVPEPSIFVLAGLGIMAWMTLAIGKQRRIWIKSIPSRTFEFSRPRSRSR
jgi:PEP-CTERM motif